MVKGTLKILSLVVDAFLHSLLLWTLLFLFMNDPAVLGFSDRDLFVVAFLATIVTAFDFVSFVIDLLSRWEKSRKEKRKAVESVAK